ncbi:hypothetical protein [Chitinophaga pinensis]|uniref:hypothetical protein n=1 Tax=Chitinophaga pinensis TaxID=79329 RepID=UPI00019E30DC|nr:hypothetical protein [Chitinophaga pinensis]
MIVTYQTSYKKIRDFTFDNGTADTSFAPKSSTSQNWTTEFTQRIADEHKRFIRVCCISPTGAAPPKKVDKPCIFSTAPPADIWPPPRKSFPIPNAPPTLWNTKPAPSLVIFIFIALLSCAPAIRQLISYILNAPQFLTFFTIYIIYILIPPLNYACIEKCCYNSYRPAHRAIQVSYAYAIEMIKQVIHMKQQHLQFNPNKL